MYDSAYLIALSNKASERAGELLSSLDIHFTETRDGLKMPCPIHGGENEKLEIYLENAKKYAGCWQCYSANCHENYQPTIIGLVWGILSAGKYGPNPDKKIPFSQAVKTIEQFLSGQKITIDKITKHEPKPQPKTTPTNTPICHKDDLPRLLDIPSPYYINRGFSAEILTRYSVGDYILSTGQMRNRAVIPTINEAGQVVGLCGRATYPNPAIKWTNGKGFRRSLELYNWASAAKHMLRTGTLYICESPLNVLRLEEAEIKSGVAVYGASMSGYQAEMITSGREYTNHRPHSIYLMTDNDDAGNEAAEQVWAKLEEFGLDAHFVRPEIPAKDIAEMSAEELKGWLSNLISCP